MRMPLIRNITIATVLTTTTGCSAYYESKAEDMAQRQMDAMVFVEGGEFMMGNPGGWSVRHDTWPPHKVVLDDFYIQKYEVTQGDFELFQSATGYEHSYKFYEKYRDKKPQRYEAELPAVASWNDAAAFCGWLGKQTDKPVTLPTEAQWEFAARSRGQMQRYATKDGTAKAGKTMAAGPTDHAWEGRPYDKLLPNPPGSFPPNSLGLYDLSGNVAEWARDKYKKDYYENSPVNNPTGPENGDEASLTAEQKRKFGAQPDRVLRGGNYQDFIGNTTITRAKGYQPSNSEVSGFRCSYSPK